MSSIWYTVIGGMHYGPLTHAELKSLAVNGQLNPQDLVWNAGLPQWITALQVEGLFPVPPQPPIYMNTALAQGTLQSFEFNNTPPRTRSQSNPVLTKSRLASPLIIAFSLVGVFVLGLAVAFFINSKTKLLNGEPATLTSIDEEFRVAASNKGMGELGVAKELIKGRNFDQYSWELLEDLASFHNIKAEYLVWKKRRIAAGDNKYQ
jgi:hypothetical protein